MVWTVAGRSKTRPASRRWSFACGAMRTAPSTTSAAPTSSSGSIRCAPGRVPTPRPKTLTRGHTETQMTTPAFVLPACLARGLSQSLSWYNSLRLKCLLEVVRPAGLEPARCYSLEPESSASANSATGAQSSAEGVGARARSDKSFFRPSCTFLTPGRHRGSARRVSRARKSSHADGFLVQLRGSDAPPAFHFRTHRPARPP